MLQVSQTTKEDFRKPVLEDRSDSHTSPASRTRVRYRIPWLSLAVATLLLASGLLTPAAWAQVVTADVLGTVTDTTGALLPGAAVTLTNTGTGVTARATSNGAGDYVFNLLIPGRYSLTIEAQGFRRVVVNNITLAAGDRVREDGKLSPGATDQTVVVSSEPPLLQTDSSSVSSVVTEQLVQDLPLNGRNFVNLVQVQPGVNEGQDGAISSGTRPDDRRATSTVSANGQSDMYNNQMIDGMDNNEREQGFIGVRPSIDAIAEVKVDTNDYSAEIGRTAGAAIDIITKSGTNRFHGSAYEYFRNDVFDARDFFTTVASGLQKPEYRQNQFGGSIGGPIVRNKTFFFADAEDNRQVKGNSSGLLTVPTAFERASGGTDFTDNGGTKLATTDPVGLALFNLYPAPNTGPAGATSDNFISAPSEPQNALSVDGRIDQHFNNGDSVFGRYSYNNVNTYLPGSFPAVNVNGVTIQPGGNYGNYPGQSLTKAHAVQFNYLHVFSPKLLMELKGSYTRIDIESLPLNDGMNVSQDLGLVNANTPVAPETTGLSIIGFLAGGYTWLGGDAALPIKDINNTFQYMGSVTYTHGPHNFKTGAQLIRRQLNYFQNDFPAGAALFAGLTGNAMEDLVAGDSLGYLRINTLTQPGFRAWESSEYAQDNWRVNHSLTLNLGLRYDLFTAFTEDHNNFANFYYPTLSLITGSQDPHVGVKTNYGNIAPRVGFSQTLWKGTVIRGGYGISYYPAVRGLSESNPPYTYDTGIVVDTSWWPVFPLPVPASTTNLSGALTYNAYNYNTASVQQFNLMLQRAIGENVFTIGGIGELGRHSVYQTVINTPAPTGPYPNDATNGPSPTPAYLTSAALPNVTSVQAFTPWATTNYYAMEAVFERRFAKGLAFNANYTLAHGLSNSANATGGFGVTGLIPTDPHYDYGNSALDIRNRLAVTGTYQIPLAQSATGVTGAVLKGWQSNLLLFWQSGPAFTVSDGYTNAYGSAQINLPGVTSDRPDVVPGVSFKPAAGHSMSQWLNPAAFTPQAAGTPGDERNEALYGPHTRRADLSLFKNFAITETMTAQFRAECYNISNTPNFEAPSSTISSWNPGPEHSAANPISEVGLLPGDIATTSGGFGTITSTVTNINPRQFQFALKLLF
jgi:hypothetical protein